jgi:hypothetical protein
MEQLLDRLRRLVDDPAVEFEKILPQATRPGAPPSRLDSEAFRVIEEGVPADLQCADAADHDDRWNGYGLPSRARRSVLRHRPSPR